MKMRGGRSRKLGERPQGLATMQAKKLGWKQMRPSMFCSLQNNLEENLSPISQQQNPMDARNSSAFVSLLPGLRGRKQTLASVAWMESVRLLRSSIQQSSG